MTDLLLMIDRLSSPGLSAGEFWGGYGLLLGDQTLTADPGPLLQ